MSPIHGPGRKSSWYQRHWAGRGQESDPKRVIASDYQWPGCPGKGESA